MIETVEMMMHRTAMPESKIGRDRHAISVSYYRVSACGHAIEMCSTCVIDGHGDEGGN